MSEDEPRSTMQTTPGREVWVHDVRGAGTSLAREGFELVAHASEVTDFDAIEEDPAVDRRYVHEMNDLLRSVTGAARVVMLGSGKKRYGEGATDKLAALKNARPARYPHGDTTDASGRELAAGFARGAGVDLDGVRRWRSTTCGGRRPRPRRTIPWHCATPARSGPTTACRSWRSPRSGGWASSSSRRPATWPTPTIAGAGSPT